MRVLQINSVCGIGSTGRIAVDIESLLLQNGHESIIAYGRDSQLPKNRIENRIKIGNKFNNYKHFIKSRLLDRHGFGSETETLDFVNLLEELKPDIIHLHNIHGYFLNIEILFEYLNKQDIPVVWTLHDCWSFTGHCTHFEYVKCNKWEIMCNNCPQKKQYPASLIIDNSNLNYMDKSRIFTSISNLTLVTPSTWLAKQVKKSFLSDFKTIVVNNGIDTDTFKPINSDFKKMYKIEDKFVILGVASQWGERKGINYFLELSNVISEDCIIVLVGISPSVKKKLPNNIIGITKTHNVEELVNIYSDADVFINPTLEDNFPTTNIEALSCGLPVITFDTGGSAEIIDYNTGLILYEKTTEALYDGINKIKLEGKQKYSINCRKRALKLYNKQDRFKEYLNLYSVLLN